MSGSWPNRAWVTGSRSAVVALRRTTRLSTPSRPRRNSPMVGAALSTRPSSTASPALTSSPTAALPPRRAVAEEGAGDLDPAARGHADGAGGGQERRWRRRWPGCPTGPTHTSTGTDERCDAVDEGVEAGVGRRPRRLLLSWSTRAMAPWSLGLGELGLDEVDEHPVEQAAHLDDGHVARIGGGLAGCWPRRPAARASSSEPGPRVRAPTAALGSLGRVRPQVRVGRVRPGQEG